MNARNLSWTRPRGFTLVEVMIVVAIVTILMGIALPSYTQYVKRSSREAVQAELVELSGLQEKIFLNSNAYSSSITGVYNGGSGGGLGVTSGRSKDGRYTLSVSVSGASFTLTATPVSGSTQAGDGNVSITSTNLRLWGDKAW
jgi:type IV pilus assembly protein PilE